MSWFKRKPKFALRAFLHQWLTQEEWEEYLSVDLGNSLTGPHPNNERRLDELEQLASNRSK